MCKSGNETNSGLLKRDVELDWPRDAKLFNAGIRAVRDLPPRRAQHPKIVLHVAQPENTGWWFTQAEAAGITDFDVIGISYYPQWSTFSIADMGAQISALRQRFGKDVMIVETGYGWTREAVDETADNILDQGLARLSVHARRSAPLHDRSDAERDQQWRPGHSLLGAGVGIHGLLNSLGTGFALGERHLLRFPE